MQTLRNTRYLARLVLAWFVLALGVAVASPVVHPKSMQVVCSSGGAMKLVVTSSDGAVSEQHGHTLDCPLCLIATASPPIELTPVALRPEEATQLLSLQSQAVPAHTASVLPPPRAPPRAR